MKCADIPDGPILRILANNEGVWCTWFDLENGKMPSVRPAFPKGCPEKVVLAKMRGLGKRGLVRGCFCGCRGDYEITRKGLECLVTKGEW